MKRIYALVLLVAMFLTIASVMLRPAFAADPEITWRNKLRTVVGTNGLACIVLAGNVPATMTNTPAYVGQLFIGTTNNLPGVWVARGATSNDWFQLKP